MGIDVPRGNDNYWMWLIPSVGQPPVKSFVLLNTLFVILVGPVCYFFFRKRHRLYLLYVFAPCLALLVTISLFAYALAADGTKTKVAFASTDLDRFAQAVTSSARHGRRTTRCWAAVAESSCQAMRRSTRCETPPPTTDTTVASGRSARRGEYDGQRSITETSADNFLPARSQVQYLMTRPEPASSKQSSSRSRGRRWYGDKPFAVPAQTLGRARCQRRILASLQSPSAGTDAGLSPAARRCSMIFSDPMSYRPLVRCPCCRTTDDFGVDRVRESKSACWRAGSSSGRAACRARRLWRPPNWSRIAWVSKMPSILDSVHVVMGEIP